MVRLRCINFLVLVTVCSSISIGRVQRARLLPGLRNHTAWLFNQINADLCLCTALKSYPSSLIAGLNSFSSNFSCQLILSPPVRSPVIIADTRSTLLLLQPLTDAPCCADIAWLLERIKAAPQWRVDFTEPTTLSLNSDKTIISTMSYRRSYGRIYRNNMTVQSISPLPNGYVCATVIHYRRRLFFGCDSPEALIIFDETNIATPIKQISMPMYVRGVSFARNDSLMFVAVQRNSWSLYIYNISWTGSLPTSLVQRFSSTGLQTWTTHTVNDTLVLLTSWDPGVPVSAIRSSSPTSNTWQMVALNATRVRPAEYLGEAVVDPCGRMWVIAYKFGIRIYDISGTVLLANWTLSTGLGNILILDDWEILLSDYDRDRIYRFYPNLKCTS